MDTLTKVPIREALSANVELGPDLYERVCRLALMGGKSVNDVIEQALNSIPKPGLAAIRHTGVSVIGWVNKPEMFQEMVMPAFHPKAGFQRTDMDVEFIRVPPEVGYKNIGQAYEAARKLAKYQLKVYVHQDAMPVDWQYLEKIRALHHAGVGATGVIGCTVPTGAAWFHGRSPDLMSGYVDMGVGRIVGAQERRVRVVDGLVLSCSLDIPWADCYEGPHMAIEDMCMRVEAEGYEVWTLSTQFMHLSGGSVDDHYWRSVEKFREVWKDRLPDDLDDIPTLRERMIAERAAIGLGVDGRLLPEIAEAMRAQAEEFDARVGIEDQLAPRKKAPPKPPIPINSIRRQLNQEAPRLNRAQRRKQKRA
jgi:hypothetical protein